MEAYGVSPSRAMAGTAPLSITSPAKPTVIKLKARGKPSSASTRKATIATKPMVSVSTQLLCA